MAARPPLRPRLGFVIAGRPVGSVEPDDARLLAGRLAGLVLDDQALSLCPGAGRGRGGATGGDDTTDGLLAAIARILHDAGRLGPWRDEDLPVLAEDDTMLGCIERSAARVLGLRTLAVHLVGWRAGEDRAGEGRTDDGRGDHGMWVQRRAPDKAVDPGRRDTLAGGMVGVHGAAGERRIESLAAAMRREADEEAGVPAATPLRRSDGPSIRIARPVAEGYMVEDLVGFEAVLDAGFAPVNRDGEVAGFECLAPDALVERIGRGEFTLEASLLILGLLRRGGRAGS